MKFVAVVRARSLDLSVVEEKDLHSSEDRLEVERLLENMATVPNLYAHYFDTYKAMKRTHGKDTIVTLEMRFEGNGERDE